MIYQNITLDDLGSLAKLYVSALNSAPRSENWSYQTAAARLRQLISQDEFYGIYAYEQDDIIGMILGIKIQGYDGIRFEIKEFCVYQDLRSQGIGTKILEELENRLKEENITSLTLVTSRGETTEQFYQKRGYQTNDGFVYMEKTL